MITPHTGRTFGKTTLPLPEVEGNLKDMRTTFAGWGPRI